MYYPRYDHFSSLPDCGGNFFLFTKYTGSIGKLVNYWRENLGDFINTWEAINGCQQPGDGVSYRRCPLRLVSNRWGSVHSAEVFILQRKRKLLQPVLLALFSKRMKAATKTPGAGAKTKPAAKSGKKKQQKTDKIDDLLDDDSRETYNIKLSKWASGACAAVLSSLWWLLLRIAQTTRAPLTHFFLWMQSSDETKKRRGVILEIVTYKAASIMVEFQDLLNSIDSWFEKAVEEVQANDLPKEILDLSKAFAAKLLLESASDFYMRIVQQTERFPLKLLWMTLVECLHPVSSSTYAWYIQCLCFFCFLVVYFILLFVYLHENAIFTVHHYRGQHTNPCANQPSNCPCQLAQDLATGHFKMFEAQGNCGGTCQHSR